MGALFILLAMSALAEPPASALPTVQTLAIDDVLEQHFECGMSFWPGPTPGPIEPGSQPYIYVEGQTGEGPSFGIIKVNNKIVRVRSAQPYSPDKLKSGHDLLTDETRNISVEETFSYDGDWDNEVGGLKGTLAIKAYGRIFKYAVHGEYGC